jgi:hypothetical protein
MLYQLSYWPLQGVKPNPTPTKLLGFAMHGMFPAARAKLAKLETIRVVTPILLSRVISLFAVITL